MIIILTATDLKDEAMAKATYPGRLTLDDFFVGLKGWPYLVAYVHHERAHILKQGNFVGNEATSIHKFWQLVSRHLEWSREEDPYEKEESVHSKETAKTIRKLSPSSKAANIMEKWQRQPRRFGLKPAPELSVLDEE